MKRLDSLHWVMLIVIAALIAYVFVTPYKYHHLGSSVLVRVHRITGGAERLTGIGWKAMAPTSSLPPRYALDQPETTVDSPY